MERRYGKFNFGIRIIITCSAPMFGSSHTCFILAKTLTTDLLRTSLSHIRLTIRPKNDFIIVVFVLGRVDFKMLNPVGQCREAFVHTLNRMIGPLDVLRHLVYLLSEKLLEFVLHGLQFTRQNRLVVRHGS